MVYSRESARYRSEVPAANEAQQKLQRRIANARGIAPTAILASPIKPITEDASSEVSKADVSSAVSTNGAREAGLAVIQKRKYRRHPKVCLSQCILIAASRNMTEFSQLSPC